MTAPNLSLISTIKEKCRMCYTCVRNCPAKAIRVTEGQASIVDERCIACGNCIRVCSRKAKKVYESVGEVEELLSSGMRVAAIVAPSFPAEFQDFDARSFVGAVRALGFSSVHEVAFGADLVAREYARLLETTTGAYISTTCPAVVSMVEKYHPELVDHLAPVVSPMVATARVVRERMGQDVQVVFVGPCIAKKGEAMIEGDRQDVQAALTFAELRALFEKRGVTSSGVESLDFDPPVGGLGSLFPISRGLLQAAGLQEDLMRGDIVVAEGKASFDEAIREFKKQSEEGVRFLDILACNGCINGAGFSRDESVLERRRQVSDYTRAKLRALDHDEWKKDMAGASGVVLSCGFVAHEQPAEVIDDKELNTILARLGKSSRDDELDCGACGYSTCRQHAVAIHRGLAEVEMCLPYTIESLRSTVNKLEETKEALIQSEKLASMGQLAAGIAHEVNNPLGVILLYANMLLENAKGDDTSEEDLQTIVAHANRCRKIVAQLLNFARQNKVFRTPTSITELVANVVKSVVVPREVALTIEHPQGDVMADLDPDQMHQVLVNLLTNACGAMPDGGTLRISSEISPDEVTFAVKDSGVGIPKENMAKIFEPFFSTKKVGKGTGLGLAVAHGIVKMHRGQIRVESNADPAKGPTGTVFKVTVPLREPQGEA